MIDRLKDYNFKVIDGCERQTIKTLARTAEQAKMDGLAKARRLLPDAGIIEVVDVSVVEYRPLV